jgi:hypothetical protein
LDRQEHSRQGRDYKLHVGVDEDMRRHARAGTLESQRRDRGHSQAGAAQSRRGRDTLKRGYGFFRARYVGPRRNAHHALLLVLAYNMKKAARMLAATRPVARPESGRGA